MFERVVSVKVVSCPCVMVGPNMSLTMGQEVLPARKCCGIRLLLHSIDK